MGAILSGFHNKWDRAHHDLPTYLTDALRGWELTGLLPGARAQWQPTTAVTLPAGLDQPFRATQDMSSAMEQASAIPESNKMSEQQLKQVSTDRPGLLGLCLIIPLRMIAPRHLGCMLNRALGCLASVSLVSSMLLTAQQLTD